jgi:hypothetical protein
MRPNHDLSQGPSGPTGAAGPAGASTLAALEGSPCSAEDGGGIASITTGIGEVPGAMDRDLVWSRRMRRT